MYPEEHDKQRSIPGTGEPIGADEKRRGVEEEEPAGTESTCTALELPTEADRQRSINPHRGERTAYAKVGQRRDSAGSTNAPAVR